MTPRPEDGGRPRVLLVDDRKENLDALELILRTVEVDLVRATSGREALKLLLDQDFSVILLDVRMPEMDGYEAAALIRGRPRSRHTPIIFVTAADMTPEHLFKGYSVGAVDYIFKPIVGEILRSKVSVFAELTRKRQLVQHQVEELRRAEEKFRALAETANDAIVSADSRGLIIYFNPAAERIFGYRVDEIVGKPLTLLMPDGLHEAHRQGFQRHLSTGEKRILGRTVELPGRRKDGTELPMELSLATWKAGDEVFFTGILRDVTERKNAEIERQRMNEQLLQGQKLQAIGQLAAGIAHEINNPTGYILSNLGTMEEYFRDLERFLRATEDALKDGDAGTDASRTRGKLQRMRRQMKLDQLLEDFPSAVLDSKHGAERIRDIVKTLRDFSHPDPGEQVPADLNQVLKNAVRLCWNELKYKARVEEDLAELPPLICHPQQIEQVFVNLLVNASQAVQGKGEIDVSTSQEEGCVVVRIRDNGCGIPAEHLGKVFEPFFTTKPVGKGTGLGLYLAHKIVTGHGGTVEVESEPGRGTRFTIRLPLTESGGEGNGNPSAPRRATYSPPNPEARSDPG